MRSDKQITEAVIQALVWDARVSPSRIEVHTLGGIVTLSGTVDNYHKKWSALDTALRMPNVVEVRDEIKVLPADAISDSELKKNIEDALHNDSRLNTANLFCTVENGTVQLHGEAASFYQKIAAEESCRWVKGVINVENMIKVVEKSCDNDVQIRRKIRESIHQNMREDLDTMDITVKNGVVTLQGEVKHISSKVYAEILASFVANVAFVRNEIKVATQSHDK
jgi:osmotically-inducible protein OsmY